MKLIAVAATLSLVALAFPQESATYAVWYDNLYDQKDTPLTSVACSNGQNGLIHHGYNTFGDLPSYPMIGGAPQIQSWNSTSCGSCWQIIYTAPDGEIKAIFFTAVNLGGNGGYTISLEGMNLLTYGDALSQNGASVVVLPETSDLCGL